MKLKDVLEYLKGVEEEFGGDVDVVVSNSDFNISLIPSDWDGLVEIVERDEKKRPCRLVIGTRSPNKVNITPYGMNEVLQSRPQITRCFIGLNPEQIAAQAAAINYIKDEAERKLKKKHHNRFVSYLGHRIMAEFPEFPKHKALESAVKALGSLVRSGYFSYDEEIPRPLRDPEKDWAEHWDKVIVLSWDQGLDITASRNDV